MKRYIVKKDGEAYSTPFNDFRMVQLAFCYAVAMIPHAIWELWDNQEEHNQLEYDPVSHVITRWTKVDPSFQYN